MARWSAISWFFNGIPTRQQQSNGKCSAMMNVLSIKPTNCNSRRKKRFSFFLQLQKSLRKITQIKDLLKQVSHHCNDVPLTAVFFFVAHSSPIERFFLRFFFELSMQKSPQKNGIPETISECAQNETKRRKKSNTLSICRIWGKLNEKQNLCNWFFLFVIRRNGAKCTLKFSVLGHLKCSGIYDILSSYENATVRLSSTLSLAFFRHCGGG